MDAPIPYVDMPNTLSSRIAECSVCGPCRFLELDGRKGINPTSIHTVVSYSHHNLNRPCGSLTYWVFSLEEIFNFLKRDVMFTMANRSPHLFPLLTDNPDLGDFENATFWLGYEAQWHPAFLAKFYRGDVFLDAIRSPQKAYAMASAFEFQPNRWYQITLTWNFPEEEIFIYANGVRIAGSDRFHSAFRRDATGPVLYSGKPTLCFGELKFIDGMLAPEEAAALYLEESTCIDEAFQSGLRRTFAGAQLESFSFREGPEWVTKLDVNFKDKAHLQRFRIQGIVDKAQITPEGLHIATVKEAYEPQNRGKQMYLWSRDTFEGDLYVEYEFRPNQPFGLSLLVFQASGMSREDLELDYPVRTTGNMHWIHSADMRCYHLEYFRHMTAVRNDLDNAALVKNPYQWVMGFGCLEDPLKEHCWHKLQVLQEEGSITAALNGKKLFTANDRPFGNNGPVLNFGRIAIRCMINTDMHFRNLKVLNRHPPYREIPSGNAMACPNTFS
jgi:hypothetical protein